ncbi:SOUL family heme-binding protein [Kaarinaea lacus]
MLKLLRINGLLILTLSMAGCSVFGIRTAEELKYDVISKSGDFEIRSYEPYVSAVATMKGPYDQVQGDLFRVLAAYIFGKNTTDSKIAMTAPVQTNPETSGSSEKIAMTAPVVLEPESEGAWKMSFSMPSEYTMQSLPKPLDPQVSLVKVPATKFAVIRFSGSFDDLEKRRSKSEELSKWLATQPQYKKMSEPVFAGYDPPFTLPFLRRNEVMIEIKG